MFKKIMVILFHFKENISMLLHIKYLPRILKVLVYNNMHFKMTAFGPFYKGRKRAKLTNNLLGCLEKYKIMCDFLVSIL